MKKLETLMRNDAQYARAWHDNLACAIRDGSRANGRRAVSWQTANNAADAIMFRFFGVKTKGPKS